MAVQTRTVKLEDGWAGQCAGPCGFLTTGWPTKKLAEERIGEHENEHETGQTVSDLDTFRAKHGLIAVDGKAVFADLPGEVS
jgi:hypothetical protein